MYQFGVVSKCTTLGKGVVREIHYLCYTGIRLFVVFVVNVPIWGVVAEGW